MTEELFVRKCLTQLKLFLFYIPLKGEDCDFISKLSEWTEIATFLYFSFALGTTLQEDFTMKLYMFT